MNVACKLEHCANNLFLELLQFNSGRHNLSQTGLRLYRHGLGRSRRRVLSKRREELWALSAQHIECRVHQVWHRLGGLVAAKQVVQLSPIHAVVVGELLRRPDSCAVDTDERDVLLDELTNLWVDCHHGVQAGAVLGGSDLGGARDWK